MLRVLDLFSGIGGFSLGLRMAGGFRTVQFCEINRNCWPTLERHFPGVPIHDDVRSLQPAAADVAVGGFPCQDISVAGKGAGIDGERSGLWREMHRVICAVRPRWVIAENVPALRTRGADRVLSDLEGAGYTCWPLVVGADDVGAPHRRKRVWIVAFSEGVGRKGEGNDDRRLAHGAGEAVAHAAGVAEREQDHAARAVSRQEPREDACGRGPRTELAHAELPRLEGFRPDAGQQEVAESRHIRPHLWPARPGERQHEWEAPRLVQADCGGVRVRGRAEDAGAAGEVQGVEAERQRVRTDAPTATGDRGVAAEQGQPEPRVGGAAHGLPARLVRAWRREALQAYGNAVVPQVVEAIGRAIMPTSARAGEGEGR